MSAPRNFRELLEVYPDSPKFKCPAYTKKGRRCSRNKLFHGNAKLLEATTLLDEMDRRSLKSSYDDLDKLANLTLCSRTHNKPSSGQLTKVTQRWREKIRQCEREEAEKTATPRTERALTRPYVASAERIAGLQKDKIPAVSLLGSGVLEPSSNVRLPQEKNRSSTADDPFMSSNNSAQDVIPKTRFIQLLEASGTRASDSSKATLDNWHDSAPPRISELPSPPTIPLISRRRTRQETEDKAAPLQIPPKKSNEKAIDGLDNSSKPFKFIFQHDLDAPVVLSQQLPLLPWDGKFLPARVPNYWPETPKTTPKPKTNQTKVFEFGFRYRVPRKTLEFESALMSSSPLRPPEKPSTVFNDFIKDSYSDSRKGSTEVLGNSMKKKPAAKSTSHLQETNALLNTVPSSTETRAKEKPLPSLEKAISGVEAPQTPVRAREEEDFGYAIITPSTRSRIYLPATKQYGLMTPPEDPDSWATSSSKFVNDGLDNGTITSLSPEMSPPRSTVIDRKPVNSPSKKPQIQDDSRRGGNEEVVFATCDHIISANGEDCPCVDEYNDEVARSGCFYSPRMRRLRKMAERKVEYLKMRISVSRVKVE